MSKYVSKQSDANGFIAWSAEENEIWSALIARQLSCIKGKACDEYMAGLDKLNLPTDRIPQLEEVSKVLRATTGWECAEVPALISFDRFFELLANKKFPVATFIRSKEEFDYLQEPDIFHEIFGHCAMLTHPDFAEFTHIYGKLGLAASKEDRVYLARLYWFTIEFGLLQTDDGLRIYGGGILSSPGETQYAMHSEVPERKTLEVVDVLRTPYRIDIMQPIYFKINKIRDLFDIAHLDLMALVQQARALGMHKPKFEPKQKKSQLIAGISQINKDKTRTVMTELAVMKCEACRADAPKVSDAELPELMRQLPDWVPVVRDGILQLERSYKFKNFKLAWAFHNKVAEMAEAEGHHPALLLEWGKLTVTWWSHSIKGLHKNDFICAAKTDQLLAG